jgi:hypothetical protein
MLLFLLLALPVLASGEGCKDLTTPGEEYNMTGNSLNSTAWAHCYRIRADNVTFDCNGYSIDHTGVGGDAFNVKGSNVTVQNCGNVSHYNMVLRGSASPGLTVTNITAYYVDDAFYRLYDVDNGFFEDFHSNGDGGIQLWNDSTNNYFGHFHVGESDNGHALYWSTDDNDDNTFSTFNLTGSIYNAGGNPQGNVIDCVGGEVRGQGVDTGSLYTGNTTTKNCDFVNWSIGVRGSAHGYYLDNNYTHNVRGFYGAADDVLIEGGVFHNNTYNDVYLWSGTDRNVFNRVTTHHNYTSASILTADNTEDNLIANTSIYLDSATVGGSLDGEYGVHYLGGDQAGNAVNNITVHNADAALVIAANDTEGYNVNCESVSICVFGTGKRSGAYVSDIDSDNGLTGLYVEGDLTIPLDPTAFFEDSEFYNVSVQAPGPIVGYGVRFYTNTRNLELTGLEGDRVGFGVYLQTPNHYVDCAGGSLRGNAAGFQFGIHAAVTGATVGNCTLNNFQYGLYLPTQSTYKNLLFHDNTYTIEQNADNNYLENITVLNQSNANSVITHQQASNSNDYVGLWINATGNTAAKVVDLKAGPRRGSNDINFTNLTVYSSGSSDVFVLGERNDNIFFDCLNGTIQGDNTSGSFAFDLNGADNVVIRNCTIRDYDTGVDIAATSTGGAAYYNFFCQNNLDATDADAATWTGNQCNTTGGNAACTSVPYACPAPPTTPSAIAHWILIKATPSMYLHIHTGTNETRIIR